MLTNLSTEVADCLQRATECAMHAEQTADPVAKASFIDLAARWRRLAESYQYTERVNTFLGRPEPVGAPPRP